MRVLVAGVDPRYRQHWPSMLCRAFRRLGCETVMIGGPEGSDDGEGGYVDPHWVRPDVRAGGKRTGLGSILASVGQVDLAVTIDCGWDWSVVNDGSAPAFAYVWREGNPNEEQRVYGSAGGAPVFCCMVNKGARWQPGTQFMPFAVDRGIFTGGQPWARRQNVLVYTGRERGNGTFGWLASRFGSHGYKVACQPYLPGYDNYAALLGDSKISYMVDPRYVGSRGIEALAQGCVVFCDGIGVPGTAHELAGLSQVCRKMNPVIQRETGEFVPTDEFISAALQVLDWPEEEAVAYSRKCRHFILANHTYESRAITIAKACGLTLPKTIEEVEACR